ncbi:flagella synthesis protein FlgN [Neptuniibacter marinus]|uniref:flagella synthesis protein FlgN n=1 Tax=Neptuniibacter marinus TaxID=1806670 RepID=UPI00082F4CED|nr:flagellar protein FlgN [Neptuniibacter marinus]
MTEQQITELNTLLEQGILLLESLSSIYDKELEALSSKDIDRLSDTTQEKMALLNSFHNFTLERVELLKSFGYNIEAGDYGLPRNMEEDSPFLSQAAEHYVLIKQYLKELQHKNKRNEQAIHRSQQNVTQLLAIVRGQKKQDQLYTKAGSSGLYKAQNRIGKA